PTLSALFHPPLTPSFFFNDTPTTEISPLSLHDALPILCPPLPPPPGPLPPGVSQRLPPGPEPVTDVKPLPPPAPPPPGPPGPARSEEHTSELQSLTNLVCRLLLEKKKTQPTPPQHTPLP